MAGSKGRSAVCCKPDECLEWVECRLYDSVVLCKFESVRSRVSQYSLNVTILLMGHCKL